MQRAEISTYSIFHCCANSHQCFTSLHAIVFPLCGWECVHRLHLHMQALLASSWSDLVYFKIWGIERNNWGLAFLNLFLPWLIVRLCFIPLCAMVLSEVGEEVRAFIITTTMQKLDSYEINLDPYRICCIWCREQKSAHTLYFIAELIPINVSHHCMP